MPRPFAVTGFTMFAVLLVLCCTGIRFCMALSLLLLVLFIVSLLLKSTRSQRVFPAAALAGLIACILFAVNYNVSYKPAVALDEKTCNLTAVLKDAGTNRYERWYYEAEIETLDGRNCGSDVTLVLHVKPDAHQGDKISGKFHIYKKADRSSLFVINSSKTFIGAYPEGYEEISVLQANGGKKTLTVRIYDLREKLKANLKEVVSGENAAIACALLFGRTGEFSDSLYSEFRAAGISHIICVSGLHLSLWALFITKLLKKAGVKRRARGAAASLFVLFYMALTGFTYSVTRAGIMMLVVLLGSTVFRRGDSINSLGIAALIILCKNPFAVCDTGFQLSFLATLGILLFLPKLNEAIKKRLKKLSGVPARILNYFLLIPATCLCAFVPALPVMILTFGEVNLMSFAGNLLTVPVVSVCMISAGITAAAPFFGPLSILKYPFGLLCSLCAKYINSVVGYLSQYRFLTFYPRQHLAFIWLGGAMLIAAVSLFFASKEKKTVFLTPFVIGATFISMLVVSDVFYSDIAEITVVNNKSALCVLVTKGDYSALIGAGADYYSTSRNTCNVLEQKHIGSLNLLVVPRDSYRESGALGEVLSCVKTDVLACSSIPDYSGLLAGDAQTVGFGSVFNMRLCDGCRITCENSENGCYATVSANGTNTVIVFESEDKLPEGDFLVCKKEVAQNTQTGNYKETIISGNTAAGETNFAIATVSVSPGSDYIIIRY